MSLLKAFLYFAILLSGSLMSYEMHAQTSQESQLDLQRGIRNYQDVMGGRKKLEQLTQQEQQEVLTIYRRAKSKSGEGKTAECRDARSRAATSATELADRSRRLRNCAEAQDYSEDCTSEFRRVKSAHSDYEDAVHAVGNSCN